MASISPGDAWDRFATPVEKALQRVTHRISDDLAAEIHERARRAGFIVRVRPKVKRRRRGR